MMYKILITLSIVISSLSCSKDDTKDNELTGKWNLIQASGTIAGIVVDYPKGEITWDFADNLNIQNDFTETYDISLLSGVYSYSINQTIEGPELTINGDVFANFTKNGNDTLELFQNLLFADGVNYLFVK